MEFSTVGKHCQVVGCNQKDFLPFECDACGGIHCLEHHSQAAHKCPKWVDRTVPVCPLCSQPVPLQGEEGNVDAAVDRHIRGGCAKTRERVVCAYGRCNKDDVLKLQCDECGGRFCVAHRFPQDHKCVSLQKTQKAAGDKRQKSSGDGDGGPSMYERISARVRQQIDAVHKRMRRKNPEQARKNHHMMMRQRAKGNAKIAPEQRKYLEIVYPFDSGRPTTYMFFSKAHSVGKVLDEIAEHAKIEVPNIRTTDAKDRLCLWSLETGEKLSNIQKLRDVDVSVVLLETENNVKKADDQ